MQLSLPLSLTWHIWNPEKVRNLSEAAQIMAAASRLEPGTLSPAAFHSISLSKGGAEVMEKMNWLIYL